MIRVRRLGYVAPSASISVAEGQTVQEPAQLQSRTEQLASKLAVPHDADGVVIESAK